MSGRDKISAAAAWLRPTVTTGYGVGSDRLCELQPKAEGSILANRNLTGTNSSRGFDESFSQCSFAE
jgi:hypothetical protein